MNMKNYRKLYLCVIAVLALAIMPGRVVGANIEWGKIQVMEVQEAYGEFDWYFTIGNPFLSMMANQIGTSLELFTYGSLSTLWANIFVTANPGDIVSKNYLKSKRKYFSWAEYNNQYVCYSDYTITIGPTDRVYLAFSSEQPDNSVTYGWMELGQDEAGMLKVYSSAWDLDGNPIAVGAIPEPSSAMMLLFGVSILALRRKAARGWLGVMGYSCAQAHKSNPQG